MIYTSEVANFNVVKYAKASEKMIYTSEVANFNVVKYAKASEKMIYTSEVANFNVVKYAKASEKMIYTSEVANFNVVKYAKASEKMIYTSEVANFNVFTESSDFSTFMNELFAISEMVQICCRGMLYDPDTRIVYVPNSGSKGKPTTRSQNHKESFDGHTRDSNDRDKSPNRLTTNESNHRNSNAGRGGYDEVRITVDEVGDITGLTYDSGASLIVTSDASINNNTVKIVLHEFGKNGA
ncbi:uncharacterized protein KGF55_005055 [Candida pseudojiufengensis]|uniref:uncharacterized protein n=1 Tax=Candida pseudojiufengensis TaxID=497109 RepID=UPI002224E3EF|nr:uncharacterized protein KGF55_005055 [Candida pseudojiufengensis]KAI5959823.1 hypothetical protein KGF55_005055 [Candida pseudojiufengensis]